MRWPHWLHARPPTVADSLCHLPSRRNSAHGPAHVRLHADCGNIERDAEHRLVRVACPALLCGSVPVRGNRIQPHGTWDQRPCRFGGWLIVDDKATAARAAS